MKGFNIELTLVKNGEQIEVTTCVETALRLASMFKGDSYQLSVGGITHTKLTDELIEYYESDYEAFLNFKVENDEITATVSGDIELPGTFYLY